jgi:hypothetical protein
MPTQTEIAAAETQIIEGNKGTIVATALLAADVRGNAHGTIDPTNYNHWKTLQLNAHALRRSLQTLLDALENAKGVGKMHTTERK